VTETARADLALGRAGLRLGLQGAALTAAGALLSGPVSLVLVNATHPEPPWRDAATFVASYHPIQTLPFFLGFVLVGGLLTLLTSLALLAGPAERGRAMLGLALGAAFAALVVLNYTVQTTFVPLLVSSYTPDDAPVLAALTMSNPRSLGWSLEMWAYGVVGVATWLAAPVFSGDRLERATSLLFVLNGPGSIASALATAFIPGWALTVPGLVAFTLWNVLVIAMALAAGVVFRRRLRGIG
jgi:hypothetical protein